MADTGQPLTEEDFNQNWLTPEEALDLLVGVYIDHWTRKKWIMDRLKSGVLIAAARIVETGGVHHHLVGVNYYLFNQNEGCGPDHFWETGDDTFYRGDQEVRCFDMRIDPESFSGRPPKKRLREPQLDAISAPPAPQPQTVTSPVERGKDISVDDAERFSRAVLAGWPTATEAFAHTKALAFFPENKVPRDWFLRIFRSIRGDKNPGPQPKIRE